MCDSRVTSEQCWSRVLVDCWFWTCINTEGETVSAPYGHEQKPGVMQHAVDLLKRYCLGRHTVIDLDLLHQDIRMWSSTRCQSLEAGGGWKTQNLSSWGKIREFCQQYTSLFSCRIQSGVHIAGTSYHVMHHGWISPNQSSSEKWPCFIFLGLNPTGETIKMAACLIAGVFESSLKDKAGVDVPLALWQLCEW